MSDIKDAIEETMKGFLSTKAILSIMGCIFIGVQVAFLLFSPSDEMNWQIGGWILSTNIAAVWLGVLGNMQVEKARAASKMVYSPDLIETLHWLSHLKQEIESINESSISTEEQINTIAPTLSKVIFRYYGMRDKIERLSNIDDDEVFTSAIEEVNKS